MKKTFKYRIWPSKKQTTLFNQTLNECRWLYNHLLEQRKTAWEKEQKSLSCFDQYKSLIQLKQCRRSLSNVHSQILQNVAVRIDLAFQAFFLRIKKGGKPGYPRLKGKFRYDSFTYPQSGFKVLDDKQVVQLSKIGRIKIKLHRPIEGKIKTCAIRRTATDKWFITFFCEVNSKPMQESSEAIGIDMGLETFATLSNGEKIENPRFFKQEEKSLARTQRKLSKQEKGSPERNKARKVVARIHERISNKRHNFAHQATRTLVNKFGIIAVEDLSINEMRKNNFRCINKSIGDAAWRMFVDSLSSKAADAGREVIKINPAYTSQTCSNCGQRHKLKLSERVFECPFCDFVLDRDHNAALNILTLGMKSLASA